MEVLESIIPNLFSSYGWKASNLFLIWFWFPVYEVFLSIFFSLYFLIILLLYSQLCSNFLNTDHINLYLDYILVLLAVHTYISSYGQLLQTYISSYRYIVTLKTHLAVQKYMYNNFKNSLTTTKIPPTAPKNTNKQMSGWIWEETHR